MNTKSVQRYGKEAALTAHKAALPVRVLELGQELVSNPCLHWAAAVEAPPTRHTALGRVLAKVLRESAPAYTA